MIPSLTDFTVLELIAESNGNFIYRARRNSNNNLVIIKFSKTDEHKKNVAQLTHEYELLKKVNNPSIIQAYELVPFQDSFLLVMEDFPSRNLTKVINEMDWELLDKLEIAINIAEAVSEIHQEHIIHKDLKPSNILISHGGKQIKIIDFGIATFLSKEVLELVNPEQMEGSLAYISPEQTGRMNRAIDYRSDIYSLGVIFYQFFTKQLPFQASSSSELINAHLEQNPVPPKEINPDIPQVISEIILKCLSKEADQRYQSAFGLKNDLEKCRDFLLKTHSVSYFVPGENDVYDHFHYPEKLFGRENELESIKECYEKVCLGNTLLLALTGPAGSGKTSLALEEKRIILKNQGRFISAKYDQYKRNIPYNGLIQAFQEIIHQILSEAEEIQDEWKDKILNAVSHNGKVLQDILPDVKLIIGNQPTVEKLPLQETENRFNSIMINFLKALILPEKPLVLFLDDFQWVDEPTLKLLQYFYDDSTIKYFMVIVAYRHTGDIVHNLVQRSLNDIHSKGSQVRYVNVDVLEIESLQEIIKASFYGSQKQTEELSSIIYQKTKGNPFFIFQFLKYLYEHDLFNFDKIRCQWFAKVDEIKKIHSDNVADFMIASLNKLSPEVIDLIKTCSVIGYKFDLDLVSNVTNKSHEQILGLFEIASKSELIIQETIEVISLENLSFVPGSGTQYTTKTKKVQYRFNHERVQEAVYNLLNEEKRQQIEYRVGRVLLETTSPAKIQGVVTEIVNHLNKVPTEILSEDEKADLVNLNLAAGIQAKESIAYASAKEYLSKGIELLKEDAWDTNFNTKIALFENLAMCRMLTGEISEAEILLDICLEKNPSIIKKAEFYFNIITLNSQMQQYDKVFNYAAKAFKSLNYSIDLNPSKLSVIKDLLRLKIRMLSKKNQDFESLPLATDERAIATGRILGALMYPSFVVGRKRLFLQCSIHMVELTFQYGLSNGTSPGLVGYATVLSSNQFNQFESSHRYGLAARNIALNNFPLTIETTGVVSMYYWFLQRIKYPLHTSVEPIKKYFRQAVIRGLLTPAATSAIYINLISLTVGKNLELVFESTVEYLMEIKKFKAVSEELSLAVIREFCLCLMGMKSDPTDTRPSEITDEVLTSKKASQNLIYEIRYKIWHIVALYLFGNYDESRKFGKEILTKVNEYPTLHDWIIFYFFHSLSIAGSYKKHTNDWKTLQSHHKIISRWAKTAPANFLHYSLLLEAEMHRIKDRKEQALRCYNLGIKTAKANGFTQDIAIGYELLGKYLIQDKQEEIASFCFFKALKYYKQWGAEAKCEDFKKVYAKYLEE